MAKSKTSKSKGKDVQKKKSKEKGNKKGKNKHTKPPITTKPDIFLPYDLNQPRKERLSLVFDANIKCTSNDNSLDKESKSLPIVLPSHGLDDLSAAPIPVPGIPAFNPDTAFKKSHVCIWEHLSKDDMKTFMTTRDNKEDLIHFLETKFPIPVTQETTDMHGKSCELLYELLYESARFSNVTRMDERKTAALLSIIYLTHTNFQHSLWQSAEATYKYVKEAFLLHTIQRPPNSAEIFSPEECRSALLYFCKIYLRHLPLVQLVMMPNYKLRMEWKPEIALDVRTENEDKPKENNEEKDGKSVKKKVDKKEDKKAGKKGKGGKKKK